LHTLFHCLMPAFIIQTGCQLQAGAQPQVGVDLTIAGLGPDAAKRLSREGLEQFIDRTGIQVKFVPEWGGSADQLGVTRRMLDQRSPAPDIYVIDAIWTGTLARHFLDLKPYLDRTAHEQLAELLNNDTVNGRLVALPFYLNVGMLYYRADLLKKYGYSHPPNTWDEMERMAARIQRGERAAGEKNFWGFVFQGAAYEGLTCNALEWQMSFGGGHIIEPDGTVTVNNGQTAEALRKAAGWVGTISPSSVLAYSEADSLNAFRSGHAAFLRYWSSGYHSIADSPAMRGRCEVALLPSGSERRAHAMGGFQLAVSSYSRHPREAAELVLFLTGSHVQKSRALHEGYLPTLPPLYKDEDVLKAVPEARTLKSVGLESWISRPSTVAGNEYAQVSRIYYDGVHQVLSHERPISEALRSMELQIVAADPRFHLRRK
jgi:trehalose/maltose transport system substrate-binding protein